MRVQKNNPVMKSHAEPGSTLPSMCTTHYSVHIDGQKTALWEIPYMLMAGGSVFLCHFQNLKKSFSFLLANGLHDVLNVDLFFTSGSQKLYGTHHLC